MRAFKGSGSGRLYSAERGLAYSPSSDPYSVGKVTGLVSDPIGETIRLRWNRVPNADGYQVAYTTNSGASWQSLADVTNLWAIIPTSSDFTARIRGYRGSGGARVYGLSYSALAHKSETSPGAGIPRDIEGALGD